MFTTYIQATLPIIDDCVVQYLHYSLDVPVALHFTSAEIHADLKGMNHLSYEAEPYLSLTFAEQ